MGLYLVDMNCPECGERHLLSIGLSLDHGPTESGSAAELYGDGELPTALVSLLDDPVWCPAAWEWVTQKDRQRVFLVPRRTG